MAATLVIVLVGILAKGISAQIYPFPPFLPATTILPTSPVVPVIPPKCGCNPISKCNRELILPPLAPQLPYGLGFLPAAVPLVASVYGTERVISPLGAVFDEVVPGAIPVVKPVLSFGSGLYRTGRGFMPIAASCTSAALATPLYAELAEMAKPVIL